MARHRARTRFSLSRPRHRAKTPVQRSLERGARSVATTLTAALLVLAMLGSDPPFPARS